MFPGKMTQEDKRNGGPHTSESSSLRRGGSARDKRRRGHEPNKPKKTRDGSRRPTPKGPFGQGIGTAKVQLELQRGGGAVEPGQKGVRPSISPGAGDKRKSTGQISGRDQALQDWDVSKLLSVSANKKKIPRIQLNSFRATPNIALSKIFRRSNRSVWVVGTKMRRRLGGSTGKPEEKLTGVSDS